MIHEDPRVVGRWLTDGAAALADALRAAGPGAPMWTPVPGGHAGFYARRFAHETVIHRVDAALALGARYALEPDVAVDALDEWMELGSLLLMVYRRRPTGEDLEVLGDARLLDFWLERVGFG